MSVKDPTFSLPRVTVKAHGVAVDMTGVAGWGGRYVLVPAHGAAMLWRESACDIEIAVLIEHYGLRNLAMCTIELCFGAFL